MHYNYGFVFCCVRLLRAHAIHARPRSSSYFYFLHTVGGTVGELLVVGNEHVNIFIMNTVM